MMLQIGFTQILADYSSHILYASHIQPACKCPKVLGIIPTSKYTKKMKRRRKAVFSLIQFFCMDICNWICICRNHVII